jgi:hypothetical protein
MASLETPILSRMLRPLTAGLRKELLDAIAALEATAEEDSRFHDLAERNAEGDLTPEERRELEAIVSANTLLSTLRLEARDVLARRVAE